MILPGRKARSGRGRKNVFFTIDPFVLPARISCPKINEFSENLKKKKTHIKRAAPGGGVLGGSVG